jgi:hypothetical protein
LFSRTGIGFREYVLAVGSVVRSNRTENDMERIAVTADHEAVQHGKQVVGRVEFVARVADNTKGYD